MRQLTYAVTMLLLVPVAIRAQTTGWSTQASPTQRALYGVAWSDTNTWVAVGEAGTILRSTDGGVAWKSIASPVADNLRGVSFHDSIGLAVGIGGRVVRTTDRGATWTLQTRPTTRALYAVSMGPRMAVTTGEEGGIFVSLDEGGTWAQRVAGTASVLFGVSIAGDVAVGVGGQGAVVMSDNRGGGFGLTVLGTQLTFFYGVSFANPLTGWAVGTSSQTGSLIIRSDLSGFTWAGQTAPTTAILFGVSFADTNEGTTVGAAGTILHTVDGGRAWSVQSSGVTQSLNAVSFATPRLGIAVGDGGTILRTRSGGLSALGEPAAAGTIKEFALEQNYPNPFNPSTTIRYSLSHRSHVTLTLFNTLGQHVAELLNSDIDAGYHDVQFNAGNLASGVYFYRLQARSLTDTEGLPGSFAETRKFVLLR